MNVPSTLERRYLLVVSGQVCRENSADQRNFWSGFINIQRALTLPWQALDVVAHSWNPEYDELVSRVYAPIRLESERQTSFVAEYMPRISPVDRFEAGLRRAGSTWARCSPQALLGNARSRSKAMRLIPPDAEQRYTQVIAARWDQGKTRSRSVNEIVFDPALPDDYLYLAYYSEVDEGYADMWFVAPPTLAARFAHYDAFVLECLSGENGYVEAFTESGWPLSIVKADARCSLGHYKKALLRRFPQQRFLAVASRFGALAQRKALGVVGRIRKFLETPALTGENSLPGMGQPGEARWPVYQALNNHAILKYFVMQNGMRERTRFLDVNDFATQNAANRGMLINPVDFVHAIYSHSSFADCWEMAIGQARAMLPENCRKIIVISDDSAETRARFAECAADDVELVTYDADQAYTERLRSCLSRIAQQWPIVYFAHEDMPLVNRVDVAYLNALLHYMGASNEFYIKLVDTSMVDDKVDHAAFPGLKSNMGGYAMSVQPALIKVDAFVAFLSPFKCGIYDFEKICVRSNLKASAVAGDTRVGKYLLTNRHFPHICTAISKGKWCTSEWSAELESLAQRYSLDLDKRGRI